jgi:YesN/AraC family two-component response regulator
MPKMLGTDLVMRVKKIMPELKIILITGYEDSIKEDSIKEYDIAEIIMKPLILSEFSKTIRNVLDAKATKSA